MKGRQMSDPTIIEGTVIGEPIDTPIVPFYKTAAFYVKAGLLAGGIAIGAFVANVLLSSEDAPAAELEEA